MKWAEKARRPRKKWGDYVMEDMNLLSGGACGTGSTDVENIHRQSNPILYGKMQTLNEHDDSKLYILFSFQRTIAYGLLKT